MIVSGNSNNYDLFDSISFSAISSVINIQEYSGPMAFKLGRT